MQDNFFKRYSSEREKAKLWLSNGNLFNVSLLYYGKLITTMQSDDEEDNFFYWLMSQELTNHWKTRRGDEGDVSSAQIDHSCQCHYTITIKEPVWQILQSQSHDKSRWDRNISPRITMRYKYLTKNPPGIICIICIICIIYIICIICIYCIFYIYWIYYPAKPTSHWPDIGSFPLGLDWIGPGFCVNG